MPGKDKRDAVVPMFFALEVAVQSAIREELCG